MDRLKKIVVGVDFTDFSKVALEQAKRVSRWSQSDLDVLHVIDKQVASDLQKTVGDSMAEVEKGLRETAQERIRARFAHGAPVMGCAVGGGEEKTAATT